MSGIGTGGEGPGAQDASDLDEVEDWSGEAWDAWFRQEVSWDVFHDRGEETAPSSITGRQEELVEDLKRRFFEQTLSPDDIPEEFLVPDPNAVRWAGFWAEIEDSFHAWLAAWPTARKIEFYRTWAEAGGTEAPVASIVPQLSDWVVEVGGDPGGAMVHRDPSDRAPAEGDGDPPTANVDVDSSRPRWKIATIGGVAAALVIGALVVGGAFGGAGSDDPMGAPEATIDRGDSGGDPAGNTDTDAAADAGIPSYTDPVGDIPEPSLDVVGSTSGRLSDGRYWVMLEFAEPWPPGAEVPQWTIIIRMYADGVSGDVAESVTVLHNGETQQPESPIEQATLDGRLLTIFADPGLDGPLLYNWMVTRQVTDGEGSRVESDISESDRRWAMDNVVDPRG